MKAIAILIALMAILSVIAITNDAQADWKENNAIITGSDVNPESYSQWVSKRQQNEDLRLTLQILVSLIPASALMAALYFMFKWLKNNPYTIPRYIRRKGQSVARKIASKSKHIKDQVMLDE